MKLAFAAILIASLLGGCAVPRTNADQVQAGMSGDQVESILGRPEASSNTPGQQCSHYTVWKDFWSRVPWDFSDRYYVCYEDGKVVSFGRTNVAVTR